MIREQLEHRPFLVVALALALGLSSLAHPLNFALALGLLAFVRPSKGRILPLICFALGLALTPANTPKLTEPRYTEGNAVVISMPSNYRGMQTFDARLDGLRYRVSAPISPRVGVGDVIHVRGLASPFGMESPNPRDLSGRLKLDGFESEILEQGPGVARWAQGWRDSFYGFTHAVLPDESAEFANGLVFRGGQLDEETRDQMRRTGTLHLIAASGLHVIALSALVIGGLTFLPVPLWGRYVAFGLVLLFYCLATGWHMPTVRASIAAMLYFGATFVGRVPDRLSALGFASAAYLLLDPRSVYDIGFQLSVTIVGFQALFLSHSDSEDGRWLRELRHIAEIGVVAVLVGEPILAIRTGEFSLMTLPANILMVSLSMFLIGWLLVSHAVWLVWSPLSAPLVLVANGVCVFLKRTLAYCDQLSSVMAVPELSPYWLVPYFGAILSLWRFRARES